MYSHLLDFVESSLTPTQYGFRRKHSTLQQMLVFLNNATSSNLQTDTVYLDFKKGFDIIIECPTMSCYSSYGLLV